MITSVLRTAVANQVLFLFVAGVSSQFFLAAIAECESEAPNTVLLKTEEHKLLGMWSNTHSGDYLEFKKKGELEISHVYPGGDSSRGGARYELQEDSSIRIFDRMKVLKVTQVSNELRVTGDDGSTTVYSRGLPVLREKNCRYDTLLASFKRSVSNAELERSIRRLEACELTVYDPVDDLRKVSIRVENGAAKECLKLASSDSNFETIKLVDVPQQDRVPKEGRFFPLSDSYDELIYRVKNGVDQTKATALLLACGAKVLPNSMASFPRGKTLTAYMSLLDSALFEFVAPHIAAQSDYYFTVTMKRNDASVVSAALNELNPGSISISKENRLIKAKVILDGPRGYRKALLKARSNGAFSEVIVPTDAERKSCSYEPDATYLHFYNKTSPCNTLTLQSKAGASEDAINLSIKKIGAREERKYGTITLKFDEGQFVKGAIMAVLDPNFDRVHQDVMVFDN